MTGSAIRRRDSGDGPGVAASDAAWQPRTDYR
jgi:hypothetical protein